MGTNIFAGQTLVAGQQPGQLNQYYGMADTVQTTVNVATLAVLSSLYTIPAGEASYAGAAYELECGGYGTQASGTGLSLTFAMSMNGTTFGGSPTIGGAAITPSQTFRWKLKYTMVCADGVSGWWATLDGSVAESGTNLVPGGSGSQSIAIADSNTGLHAASVGSPISVSIQCKWSATTGSPTITNILTTFRKVA